MTTPRQLKAMYEQGVNISTHMRSEAGLKINTRDIIEVSYDLQTGSYISAMEDSRVSNHIRDYSKEISTILKSFCNPKSILEAGVGEATTLSAVLKNLGHDINSYGFDLSWSRVAYARNWLKSQGNSHTNLCTGDLYHIPFSNDSIDVVYTSHAVEPNGGNERQILEELYRVTRKYLVLCEPGYELANREARKRMDTHGYCKNLPGISESLGYNVIEHKLSSFSMNAENPTAFTVIKKDSQSDLPLNAFACPQFKTPLKKITDMFYSPEALRVYPIIGGIPCLRIENGVFASKYAELFSNYQTTD